MSVIIDTVILTFKLAAPVIYKEKLLGVTFLVAVLLVSQFRQIRTVSLGDSVIRVADFTESWKYRQLHSWSDVFTAFCISSQDPSSSIVHIIE